MLSAAHTLLSLAFGMYIENPIIIFASAFTFHLFADTVLHWNIYPDRWGKLFYPLAIFDVTSGVALAWAIMGNQFFTWPILIAIAGGNMPDILHTFWEMIPRRTRRDYLKVLQPAFQLHDSLQLETKKPLRGLYWQIILVALAITIVYLARN